MNTEPVSAEGGGRFVVAFTKDWDDVPTCTTHILRETAKTIPVLWVCSIGTRKPQAWSAKDRRRILVRLCRAFSRSVWQENRLRVLRPLLIPKAESRGARWLNRRLFDVYLWREKRLLRRLGSTGRASGPAMGGLPLAVEFWCFVPNAVDLLPAGAQRVIYYCADDWTKFHNLDGRWLAGKETALMRMVSIVFATSRFLEQKLRVLGTEVRLSTQAECPVLHMPHGVEYERFAAALDRSLPLPEDLRLVPAPVVGFYGNLHPWVDFDLIEALARARPAWSFFLIGEVYDGTEALRSLPNVWLAGRREHAQLPDYCRGFAAAMIPYDMSHPRMESVNPVKTKELLAAGVPVVASRVPALDGYGDAVMTCDGTVAWLEALECQLQRTEPERRLFSESVSDEDWSRKVEKIHAHILGVYPPALPTTVS